MDPQSALSYSSRALLLERLGRPDQVGRWLRRGDAASRRPDRRPGCTSKQAGLQTLAAAHHRPAPQQALPDHERAVALDGGSAAYLKHRGLCYRTLGQYAAAVADFSRCVRWGHAHLACSNLSRRRAAAAVAAPTSHDSAHLPPCHPQAD